VNHKLLSLYGLLEKGLANLWSRRKITQKTLVVRGQEIKREIPIKESNQHDD